MHKCEASNKEYVSLSIAAPEIGSKKLYAKLDEEAGAEASDFMP
jgi:uncharacterized protein (DUF736 family)